MSSGRARKSIAFDPLELYGEEECRTAIERLRERRAAGERLSGSDIAAVTARSGTSDSTVRRRIRNGFPTRPQGRFKLTRQMRVLIVRNGGNVAATVRRHPDVFNRGVRTVQYAVRALGDAHATALRKGEKAAQRFDLTVLRHYPERNMAWFIDAFFCRRRVLTANGRGVRNAWAFVVVEAASGLVLAVTVVREELRPDGTMQKLSTADALHAVGEAMRSWPELGPGRGRCGVLFHDNQGCFTGQDFQLPLRDPLVGIGLQATAPFQPRHNGRVESRIGAFRKLLARPLEDGSYETLDGQPLVAPNLAAVPLDDLIAELKAAAIESNRLRWRDGSCSKSDAFDRLRGEIRPLPREVLSRFLRRARVPVYTTGVTLERQAYMHGRLRTLVNREVEVRYRDMDDAEVEVYLAGKFVCVAKNVRDMTDEDLEVVYLARGSTREARQRILADAARAEERWAEERREAHRLATGQRRDPAAAPPAGDPFGEDSDDA